jgi:acetylornithine/N-succinyldiaminopimelate aminotransferase
VISARVNVPSLMPVYARSSFALERGDGVYVYDTDNNEYLDFAAGIGVSSFGHGHPHLTRALHEQSKNLWHTSNMYRVPGAERLANRLVAATFAHTVFFTNSGAEAWECAFKVVRSFNHVTGRAGRHRVITCRNAFHGRTMAAIAATDQEKLRVGFSPLPDWFEVVAFNDLQSVEKAIDGTIGGIMFETVQGEGGVTPATPEFMRGVRDLCDRHEILLVLDEIQCGIARTGRFLAHEHYGITPDVVAIAKAIGAGFPLGACLATERAAMGMTLGSHGSTTGGNPLAMAIGNAVLDIVFEPSFMAGVRERAAMLRGKLQHLVDTEGTKMFTDVRGLGLMLGLSCRVPSRRFVEAARNQGLLTAVAGQNVVRLLPPLIIEERHMDEACEKLRETARLLA